MPPPELPLDPWEPEGSEEPDCDSEPDWPDWLEGSDEPDDPPELGMGIPGGLEEPDEPEGPEGMGELGPPDELEGLDGPEEPEEPDGTEGIGEEGPPVCGCGIWQAVNMTAARITHVSRAVFISMLESFGRSNARRSPPFSPPLH